MKPELVTEIQYADAGRYVVDPAYAMQRKRDGKRLLIVRTNDGANVYNKHGEPTSAPEEIVKAIPPGVTLDGELESRWYHPWDVLSLPGSPPQITGPLHAAAYATRLLVLDQLDKLLWFNRSNIIVGQTYYEDTAKESMLLRAVDLRWEGVVFKKLDAAYLPGRADQHVKLKFKKTCTARVRAVEPTRAKIEMLFPFPTGWRDVCDGVSLMGKEPVKVGDYLEVQYLYASHNDRLVQPVMLRVRDDANDTDCRTEQLVYKVGDAASKN